MLMHYKQALVTSCIPSWLQHHHSKSTHREDLKLPLNSAEVMQVREYMDRMVKADGDASKAQADANKAQKALRQLEIDVDALR